jgi:hypothetical protein
MENNWLNSKAKSYYSQNGEDGIIEAIFEAIVIYLILAGLMAI